jgi:hypothetical protein
MNFFEQLRKLRDEAKYPNLDRGRGEREMRDRAFRDRAYRPMPTTDMGLSKSMPDWMKPRFRINSLDKQNNDPLKTGSIDSFKGNTDVKPIPSATFSGSVSKIPNLTTQ